MAVFFSKSRSFLLLSWLLVVALPLACVDPEDLTLRGTVDVIVVDGTITNLAEPQIIRLNRSRADPLTGRFGVLPITKATVNVVIDSVQVIACHETVDGSYQLPADFKGQVGHAYQLRFTLADGKQYVSTQQVMANVPPINQVYAQFNPKSIFPPIGGGFFTAGHDLFVDFQDPADQRNYYRWDWKLWEKQEWCRTCLQGIYSIYTVTAQLIYAPYKPGNYYIYTSGNTTLLEDCYYEIPPPGPTDLAPIPFYSYDYACRTQCWDILYSHDVNVFDDQYTNGGPVNRFKVAQIPFYDHNPGLVEIRQGSLTPAAYRYFKQLQQQTQNTGGIADTPPAAPVGNVHNIAAPKENVVGYFTAGAVYAVRYWLDRKDAYGVSLGGTGPLGYGLSGYEFFYAINLRYPQPEPPFARPTLFNSPPRPPTVIREHRLNPKAGGIKLTRML